MFLTCQALITLYQFWIHTRAIDRLGPLEAVLTTPSHHRVHHGCNPRYLDRNYAGFLILWDKVFGTFQAEEEEPTYGLVKPLASWNPVYANLKFPLRLWQHSRSLPSIGARLGIWFKGPSALPSPENEVEGREKYDASVSGWRVPWVILQFITGLSGAVFLLFTGELIGRGPQVVMAVWVLATLTGVGAVFENKPWARIVETARLTALPAVVWFVILPVFT
jgi:hypothetical protein